MQTIGKFLPLKAVQEFSTLSRASIYRRIKLGTFPQPVKIGERRVAWRSEDIHTWMSDCSASHISAFDLLAGESHP